MFPADIPGPSRLPMSPLPDPPGPPSLTPIQKQELAERYAPILYFDPREENFLQDPNTFISQSSLREEVDGWFDNQIHGRGNIPPSELACIGPKNKTKDDPLFLDHREEDLGNKIRAGDLANSKNLYEYDAESNTITYHLFYSFNDGAPGVIGDLQDHESDWEKVTIQLDDNLQPTAVRYSAHSKSSVERSWSEVKTEFGRPVVYVNKGSHANSPEPGIWKTDSMLAVDESKPGGRRFDLAGQPALDITKQEWYGGYVKWGEQGLLSSFGLDFTSGPTGPSRDKGPIKAGDADPNRHALHEFSTEADRFPYGGVRPAQPSEQPPSLFGPNGLLRRDTWDPNFPSKS